MSILTFLLSLVFILVTVQANILPVLLLASSGYPFAAVCCLLTQCWQWEEGYSSKSRGEEGLWPGTHIEGSVMSLLLYIAKFSLKSYELNFMYNPFYESCFTVSSLCIFYSHFFRLRAPEITHLKTLLLK